VDQEISVDGRNLKLTRLEKPLFPSGFTKAEIIDYYVRCAPWLLPHLKDRPVTLKRFPDGVRGFAFYEKNRPSWTPAWVRVFPVPRRAGGADIQYVLINDVATLAWCANSGAIELHPFLHTAPEINQPRSVVFDLDPGEPADIFSCAEVAFHLKDWLTRRKLRSFIKASGSKGLQLYVPLNTSTDYERTRAFAHAVADTFEKEYPNLCVSRMDKDLRPGKVFIDWSQNADFKTTVGVYSMRAKNDRPFISAPLTWAELQRAFKKRDRDALYFSPAQTLGRLEKSGDLFGPVLTLHQKLPET
jgi:bifunctional non-homologous end joining protein LigD